MGWHSRCGRSNELWHKTSEVVIASRCVVHKRAFGATKFGADAYGVHHGASMFPNRNVSERSRSQSGT